MEKVAGLCLSPVLSFRKSKFAHNVRRKNVVLRSLLLFGSVLLMTLAYLRAQQNLTEGTDRVLQEVPLTDGHNNWAIWLRVLPRDSLSNVTEDSSIDGLVDIPRLSQGRTDGAFESVYVECPEENDTFCMHTKFPDSLYWERVHEILQQVDFVKRVIQKFPTIFEQTAHCLGCTTHPSSESRLDFLRQFYDLGVRYATLIHDCHNRYTDAAVPDKPFHRGLSAAGRALIHEMNRLGMAVDLALVSEATMCDALVISHAPVMFSHSSAYSLCPNPRNLPDDVLDLLRENKGIVMITFYPQYTRCDDSARASLGDVADHIEYVVRRIGINHVGIGSDFDGMAIGMLQLEDVSKYPALVQAFLRRSMSIDGVKKVVGLNLVRVLGDIERVRDTMASEPPLEDIDEL